MHLSLEMKNENNNIFKEVMESCFYGNTHIQKAHRTVVDSTEWDESSPRPADAYLYM